MGDSLANVAFLLLATVSLLFTLSFTKIIEIVRVCDKESEVRPIKVDLINKKLIHLQCYMFIFIVSVRIYFVCIFVNVL